MAATYRTPRNPLFFATFVVAFSPFSTLAFSEETQHDETIRNQISEGLNLSSGVAAAVNEFFQEHGRFPENNQEAGLVAPIQILGKYVISVAVGAGDGSITIEYGNYADPIISGATLTLHATVKKPRPTWSCRSDYIDSKYFPVNCGI